jgi:hypothetical protein
MCCNEGHGHHHGHHHGGQCDEGGHGDCDCGCHGGHGHDCDCGSRRGHDCCCERGPHHERRHCGCCEGEPGRHFHRRFHTREERLVWLEEYLKELQAEVKAVEEQMAELKGDR